MSTRFPGTGANRLTRGGALPATDNLTVALFGRIVVDRNDFSTFFALQNTAGSDYVVLETDLDGVTILFVNGSGALVTGPALTVGTWYFIAITSDGSTDTLYVGDADAGTPFVVNSGAGPGAARVMDSMFYAAHDIGGTGLEPLNGRMCGVRVWEAVLSQVELEIERERYNPFRRNDLVDFYPMSTAGDKLVDYSPNHFDLTAPGAGTWTTEANPNQPWVTELEDLGTLGLSGFAPTVSGSSGPSGWVGTPVIVAIGAGTVRITGLSLNAGGIGTVGLSGSGADIELPAPFTTGTLPTLTLSDLVEVDLQTGIGSAASHINVDKSEGPFTLTFTNAQAGASGPLEIYVKYHHSVKR